MLRMLSLIGRRSFPLRGAALLGTLSLVACSSLSANHALPNVAATAGPQSLGWLDRVTWGGNASSERELAAKGLPTWLFDQLHPTSDKLPAAAQAKIDAMAISRTPAEELAVDFAVRRKAADEMPDGDARSRERLAYQKDAAQYSRESQERFFLRALYSSSQLREQMTWFWMNHFSVSSDKEYIATLVGDYEESAVRTHALGRFRDLLVSTSRHPAMLRYLDNEQNAAGRVNENYARELMELHTMGVGSGYTQKDVQELARVLTGVGFTLRSSGTEPPKLKPELQADYVRQGLFEFNPGRHDYGPKTLLGRPLTQRGLAEVDEALDRLSRSPATAHFISNKLAVYFVADVPPPKLVERMEGTFLKSDGDIAAVLTTMFESPEFSASLGQKFRDPMHYVIGGVRLAYDDRVALNMDPMMDWVKRMGERPYGHETPDGYPLTRAAWSSASQMITRFEIARAIGANGAVLFRTDEKAPLTTPAFPAMAESQAVKLTLPTLGAGTRNALAQAKTPQDWNTFLLSSPEFMHR